MKLWLASASYLVTQLPPLILAIGNVEQEKPNRGQPDKEWHGGIG